MANKIYLKGQIEIVDVSGLKSVPDLIREFGGNPSEYIEKVINPPSKEYLDAKIAEAEQDKLIQDKIREIAVTELKKEGKL